MDTNSEKYTTSTQRIDALRTSLSQEVIDNTVKRFEKICALNEPGKLNEILRRVFPNHNQRIIREFFIAHPVSFSDLLRKIHHSRKFDKEKWWWYIEEGSAIWEIYVSFLVRWRVSDIGKQLRNLLPDSVTKNQELLRFADDQPSLLDEWGYLFSKIKPQKRQWQIKNLIVTWLLKNLWEIGYTNIDTTIWRILPKLLKYLKEILQIDFPSLSDKDWLDSVSRKLERMFSSGKGEQRENAFRLIQAFHAWSGIEIIESLHEKAKDDIPKIPDFLKRNWIIPISEITTELRGADIIYHVDIALNGKKYHLEYRLKSIKSILQKMWETEEYTNENAIRDMIGLAFIWDDDTSTEDKRELLTKLWTLMPNFGYLFNNKWGINNEDIDSIAKSLQEKKKEPIYVSRKISVTTDPKFANTAFSGFMNISGNPFGTEIQAYSRSFADWKKVDDKKYKPKWMLATIMRWPKFSTPGNVYNALQWKITQEALQEIWLKNINQLILSYIESWFLIPYVSVNGWELLITHIWVESSFKEKFPEMKKCEKWTEYYKKMLDYLESLK